MKKWMAATGIALKIYKWRLLILALALVATLLIGGSAAAGQKLPPGSAPAPQIDPL